MNKEDIKKELNNIKHNVDLLETMIDAFGNETDDWLPVEKARIIKINLMYHHLNQIKLKAGRIRRRLEEE